MDETENAPTVVIPHVLGPDRAADLRAAIETASDGAPGGGIPPAAVRVATTPDESREAVGDAEVLVTFRLPEEWLAAADRLAWVQVLSAGVDHLDIDRLAEEGVLVTNASGVHAEPIAEQVLGYALAFERNLHAAMHNKDRGVWEQPRGGAGELRGKTVGIVGVGAIGTRVAEHCAALGMEVVGVKRDTDDVPGAVDEIYAPEGLDAVLRAADYLVLSCPLTDETRGLIGRDELRRLGGDAVLINVARGEVVDEEALTRALRNRRVGGAALDVFEEEPLPADSPLWDLSDVVLTPHYAGSTPRYLDRCGEILVENYRRFREGDREGMRNRVV